MHDHADPRQGGSDWGLERVKRDWVPGWLWRLFCVGNLATFAPWREILTKGMSDTKQGDDLPHRPQRGDDVEKWLHRQRDAWNRTGERPEFRAIDSMLDRYRECADYGLTLRPEDNKWGDP